jgi:O-antigen ligase
MSIRITVLSLIVAYLSVYAWRDWFRALCGAIVLMAFLQHPDMPKSMLGILGFNLWNVLLLNVLGGWIATRQHEGLIWDMPRSLQIAFLFYLAVVIWAFLRLVYNPTEFYPFATYQITVNYLINPVKFLIPGILLYDGCRTSSRVHWGLASIILLYFLLSAQVMRHMGLQIDLSGAELSSKASNVIHHSTGYNRVDMSMMLAGASWATVVFSQLMISKRLRWACWVGAGIILFALALTGGRMGYVTWGLVGLVLCLAKWRKLLLLLPMAAVMVCITVPGVRERMLEGFGGRKGAFVEQTDSSQITSGRTEMWPYVIQKIEESPLLGYGRLGMIRTGLSDELKQEVGEGFGHPHNAYLELLLDNGILGALCALPLFAMIVRRSLRLFKNGEFVLYQVAGGVALALFLALLFAGFGAQTFYPRESTLGMWAAAGIVLRVWVERESGRTALLESEASEEPADESTLQEAVYL